MPINKLASLGLLLASLAVLSSPDLLAQTKNSAISAGSEVLDSPAQLLKNHAWEYGPFVQGGFGVGDRSSFHFFTVGAHAGKVLSRPFLPGVLRGQFEYAAELMPL
jgi:hypothetical protein